MDLTVFVGAAVSGVPLIFLVFGLVEILKRLKKDDGSQAVSGNGILLGSLGIGLVIGVLYTMYAIKPPDGSDLYAVYAYWFAAVVYGLGLGIFASIFYETLKALVEKAVEKLVDGGLIKVIKT